MKDNIKRKLRSFAIRWILFYPSPDKLEGVDNSTIAIYSMVVTMIVGWIIFGVIILSSM